MGINIQARRMTRIAAAVLSLFVMTGCPNRIRTLVVTNKFKETIYVKDGPDTFWEFIPPGQTKVAAKRYWRAGVAYFEFMSKRTRKPVGRLSLSSQELNNLDDGETIHVIASPSTPQAEVIP